MFSKPKDRRKHHRRHHANTNTGRDKDKAENDKSDDNSMPKNPIETKATPPEPKLLGITAPLSLKAPDATELAQTEALRAALQPFGVFQTREEMLERVAHLSSLLEIIGELDLIILSFAEALQ